MSNYLKTNEREILRYYIVNLDMLDQAHKIKRRSRIIQGRPTRWSVFLRGLLKLDDSLAFIHTTDAIVQQFLERRGAAYKVNDHRLRINNHLIAIEPWTIWNCLKFCLESFQYGTFQRIWKWRF